MIEILYHITVFPIVQIMELIFTLTEFIFRNRGLSIIIIGFTLNILCIPIYNAIDEWQSKERNIKSKLQKKVKTIKEVFSGDEQFMILSTYYKQNNYHPLYALRTSLGLIIQAPFFIAAYYFISGLNLLNGIPFLFISNLQEPDSLLVISSFNINILPVFMTLINLLSSFIYTKNYKKSDKLQSYFLSSFFLVLLYNMPSALVLYWITNNIFSLLRNLYKKINYKNKIYILLSLFTIAFILLGIISFLRFGLYSETRLFLLLCIFLSILPWLVIIFLKSKIINSYQIKKTKYTFLVFIVSLLLLWSLNGLYIPSQLISSSPQEFSYIDNYTSPFNFIFFTLLQTLSLFVIWPLFFYTIFQERVKCYLSLFFFILSIFSLVNVFIFPGNYGLINLDMTFETINVFNNIEYIINNVLIILLPIILIILNKYIIDKFKLILLSVSCFSIFTISSNNYLNIKNSYNELKNYYIIENIDIDNIEPIFSLSKSGSNLVVFMIDRALNGFIPYIFEEDPLLYETFSGFTYYPNTVSFNGFTRIGAPPVFGGYEYTPLEINKRYDVPLVTKHNEALLLLPSILSKNNFTVVVTDPIYAGYNWRSDLSIYENYPFVTAINTRGLYVDSWLNEHNLHFSTVSSGLIRNIFWYSLFKSSPIFLRTFIYFQGSWCSPVSDRRLRLALQDYAVLDYLPRLTHITDDYNNYALLLTNNLTHENTFLQAPEYIPYENINNFGTSRFSNIQAYHVNMAAIKRISEWLLFLKENDLYDNTRIIIVSDHGTIQNHVHNTGLSFNLDSVNPLLMIKDFNSIGIMTTDYTFMSNADVPYLLLKGVIENPINPFTGNQITIEMKNEPLYIALSGDIHITFDNNTLFTLNPSLDYYVHTNIFDPANWIRASLIPNR